MKKHQTTSKLKKSGKTQPIIKKEEVPGSNDNRIDEDFPGYPHHPASERIIHPNNKEDRKSAGMDEDDGSAGAFDATENPERWEE